MKKIFQLFRYSEGHSPGDKANFLFLTNGKKRKTFVLSDWWCLQFRALMDGGKSYNSNFSSERFKNFQTVSHAIKAGKEKEFEKLYHKFIFYRWRWAIYTLLPMIVMVAIFYCIKN